MHLPTNARNSPTHISRIGYEVCRLFRWAMQEIEANNTSRSNLFSVQDRTENSTPSGESPTSSSSAATDGNPRSFSHNLRSAGRHLGNICTFNGTPVLSKSGREWLKSCTGQEFHLDRFPADVKGWQLSQPRDPSDIVELPPLDGFLAGVEQYQSSAFGIMFPLIDTPLLRHTINAAYYNIFSDDSFGSASARACILAFHAHILTVLPTHEIASPRPAIDYFREAYALLPEVIHETATLDGLQAILAMVSCSLNFHKHCLTRFLVFMRTRTGGRYLHNRLSPLCRLTICNPPQRKSRPRNGLGGAFRNSISHQTYFLDLISLR